MLSKLLTSIFVPKITITSIVLWSGACKWDTCRTEWGWDSKLSFPGHLWLPRVPQNLTITWETTSALQRKSQSTQTSRTPTSSACIRYYRTGISTWAGEWHSISYLRCLEHGWQIGKMICFLTHIFQSELAVMCRFQEISPNSIWFSSIS